MMAVQWVDCSGTRGRSYFVVLSLVLRAVICNSLRWSGDSAPIISFSNEWQLLTISCTQYQTPSPLPPSFITPGMIRRFRPNVDIHVITAKELQLDA
ncbi:hypothetical protein DFH29DRAFT_147310 [Suillus ampliporus]|nr:hypothetical protein DFH29DRAFT_147310 [Suillus ampliporus]